MDFTSDYNAFRQNAYKKRKTTGDEFTDEFINALDDEHYQQYEDLAPVKKQTQTTTKTEAPVKEDKKWYDGFLQLGDALSDGYQLGDITKTLLGTNTDIATNAISGVVGWGEDVLDAGATLASRVTGALGMKDTSEKLRQFAETDQYDAQEVSRKILSSNFMGAALGPLGTAVKNIFTLDDWMNSKEVDNGFGGTTTVREDNSILGDTSDSMIQSAGEIVAKKGLQMATGGIPIADIITGVTVFGSQAEQALKEDATLDEAIGSGLISAGAEIIFEKLSDGIKFGNTTLDGKLTKLISDNISKIAVRNGVHLLKDIAGESLEEVATEFFSRLGTALYKEEDLSEILGSEEAINSYIQSAITGGLMGGGFSGSKAIGGWKGNYDYKTGLTNTEQTKETEVADEPIAEEQVEPQSPEAEKTPLRDEREKLNNITEEATENASIEDLQKEYNAVYQQFREANRANNKEAVSRLSQRLSDLNQQISKAEANKTIDEEAAYAPNAEDLAPSVEDVVPAKKKPDLFETSGSGQMSMSEEAKTETVAEEVAPANTEDAEKAEARVKQSSSPAMVEDFNKLASKVYNSLKAKPTNKYHKVGKYGVYIGRNSADRAVITIKKPNGENVRYNIEGGKYWKNERLWHEAAEKVAKLEYPNIETPAITEDAEKAFAERGEKLLSPEETSVPKKKSRIRMQARMLLSNKHAPIEDLALKTGNRELMAKANALHLAESSAQYFIGNGEGDVRALTDIKSDVEKSGLYDEFKLYLHDWLNVDRMSLEAKAKKTIENLKDKFGNLKLEQIYAIAAEKITNKTTEKTAKTIKEAREYVKALDARNKAVYGDNVTADMTRAAALEAEAAHPEFKKWAQDMYDIAGHLRKKMVEKGVISQELSDTLEEMYPHYIPIHRAGKDGAAINVPLDTNKTGVNTPMKRATGGDSAIEDVFKTFAERIEQTYKAIAKNSLGMELKNTLGANGTTKSATYDEITEDFENPDELLKKGTNDSAPTFTIFDNGERVTFEITEDIFDALKPTNEILAQEIKAFSVPSKIQKKILTEYNLLFSATNAIKDAQSVFLNSQHAVQTYKNMPEAFKELLSYATKGETGTYLEEYLSHGGDDLSYFDNNTKNFKQDESDIKKVFGYLPNKISELNNFIEKIPRLAEYIASRKAGASIDVAMLDAARVTTNFAAGGDFAKFINRNGFTFFNASMQGFSQQVRNIREAKYKGFKGVATLVAKYAIAGLPILLFNALMWDDDEDYEELADYVKDNYYIIAKYGDGKFVRIPKGREMAVIQNAFEQMKNLVTGNNEVDLMRFGELLVENLAPNNPLNNNIIAPFVQAHTNKAWYGDDIVPTRLQDLPNAEQYDESTDAISKWLGEKTNLSPYRINYLLDQYSGGIGDVFLPMLTPETDGGGMLAPWQDKFTTDSVMNNQNVSDFYDTMDKLTANAKSSKATDEDVLKYKYFNAVNSELSELYKQKREIQNGDLPDDEKSSATRELQERIVSLTRDSLNTYKNVNIEGSYASIGDVHFRQNDEGEWQKISDEQLEKQEEVTSSLGISPSEYWGNKEEYDFAYENPGKYKVAKAIGGYDAYKTYSEALNDLESDKDASGKSISGSRKEKVIDYVNNLDADYGTKIILFKSEYKADDTYNYDIIDYLDNREDISYEEMVTILKELDFTVHSDGRVTWD